MIERIEINLLPVEYRVHKKNFEIKSEVIYPLIGVVVVAVALTFITIALKNTLRVYRNEIKIVNNSIEINRPIKREIDRLRQDNIVINNKIKALELINVNREKWVKLMEEISGRLPDYTWLQSIKEINGEKPVLSIEGRTYSFPEVANFMSNLTESNYIKTVDLSRIEQVDSKNHIFRFALSCEINPEAYLMKNENVVLNESVRNQ